MIVALAQLLALFVMTAHAVATTSTIPLDTMDLKIMSDIDGYGDFQRNMKKLPRVLASGTECRIKNSISCFLISNGTACSKLNPTPLQCNVSVYYNFNACNLATKTNFTIIRYSAHILHQDVSPGLFNGTTIPAGSCRSLQKTHLLNTCDMKTDFASLYVRGKTNGGTRCEDYLFHWANGLESRTEAPSRKPTKQPMIRPRPSNKPSKRPVSKPTLTPIKSPHKPTRPPLAPGQYYFSPTNQLITGNNVCSIQNHVSCTLASNGTDCAKLLVQPSSCYVPVIYTFVACNMAATTRLTIARFTARVMHMDVSGETFSGTILPGGVCQMSQRYHKLNTCDVKTDFGSLYINGKTQSGMFCGSYLFHWANGLESLTDPPTTSPTRLPTSKPSTSPTGGPTAKPSTKPTNRPTTKPSLKPTARPTSKPSTKPTTKPSSRPSLKPTNDPTVRPSSIPTVSPTKRPSRRPSTKPSLKPSIRPSTKRSLSPSKRPSARRSLRPTKSIKKPV